MRAPGSEHVPNCTLHIGLQQYAHFAVCTSCLSKGNFQPSTEVSTIYQSRVRSSMKTQLPLCRQEASRPNSNAACKRDALCISSQCEARVAASTLVASAACILRQACLARRSACRQAMYFPSSTLATMINKNSYIIAPHLRSSVAESQIYFTHVLLHQIIYTTIFHIRSTRKN